MHVFNRVLVGLILMCALVISFTDTFHLFASFGFTLPYAIVGAVMALALLVIGGVNIIRSGVKEDFNTLASLLPAFLGVGIMGWGNVLVSMDYGMGGVLLGIAVTIVPISIIIFLIHAKEQSKI